MRWRNSLPAVVFVASVVVSCGKGERSGGASSGTGGSSGAGGSGGVGNTGPTPEGCVVESPSDSLTVMGDSAEGYRTPEGRLARSSGPQTMIAGFPHQVELHPTLNLAYVVSRTRDDRRIVTVDLSDGAVLQDLELGEIFFGLAISSDGSRLYASSGDTGGVHVFDVAADGTLDQQAVLTLDGGAPYTAGLALSPDDSVLYVGNFLGNELYAIDTATQQELGEYELPIVSGWDLVTVPSTGEVWISALGGNRVAVFDPVTEGATAVDFSPGNFMAPAGMALDAAGNRMFVALSGRDQVAMVDLVSHEVVTQASVVEGDWLAPDDKPLPHSNVNALAFDELSGRLWVSRGSDNAISVLQGGDLAFEGSIPTAWYPSDVALTPGGSTLVVLEGKGAGSGPGDNYKGQLAGTLTRVDVLGLDLEATTQQVVDGYRAPSSSPEPACDRFPVGKNSPIEHVVLIVKENKKFDQVFGDLDLPGLNRDETLVEFGEQFTPNLHKLAREFTIADSFYSEAPNSDYGHVILTTTHVTEYVERAWLAALKSNRVGLSLFPTLESALPTGRNFFSHLVDHGIDIRIFGEIVGTNAVTQDGGTISEFSDPSYPGGVFSNYGVKDEVKGRYVADQIANGSLAQFSFVLLPNDHGEGTTPGKPTRASHVSDNDLAVGVIVEALSQSPFWEKTIVFITQDDPQGGADHVDAARTLLVIAGPHVRRGYISHTHTSFISLLATVERIFDVPPMGRPDASARVFFDPFRTNPDLRPYVAEARRIADEVNPTDAPGADMSDAMDFSTPDRNPELFLINEADRLWRSGSLTKRQAQAWLEQALVRERDEIDEEAEEDEAEVTAHDVAIERHRLAGRWKPEWDAELAKHRPFSAPLRPTIETRRLRVPAKKK